MTTKHDLKSWVVAALKEGAGHETIVGVARYIWINHQKELAKSGELFFTWQYDMRWCATELRKEGVIKSADVSPTGVWELV